MNTELQATAERRMTTQINLLPDMPPIMQMLVERVVAAL